MPVSRSVSSPVSSSQVPVTVWLSYALARGITARHRREALARYREPGALGRALLQSLGSALSLQCPAPVSEPGDPAGGPPAEAWSKAQLGALRAASSSTAFEAALAWQQAGPARYLIGLDDPRYPQSLLATDDPPPLLYLRGDLTSLTGPQVAIVGSRQATGPALAQAHGLAAALADAGIGVVSGLARGIDAAAHRGALDGGGGTVAVQATAPDRIYPAAHRELATAITHGGSLLTEFPVGSVLRPGCFPRRNRLISGLTLGVVVVEASLRSGSLITARHAAAQGREVMAMPGSVANPQVRGCHELLRQGATLVESVDDVLLALQPALQRSLDLDAAGTTVAGSERKAAASEALHAYVDDPDAATLLACMGFDAMSIDALVDRSGLPVARVARALTRLELDTAVAGVAGARYQRRGGTIVPPHEHMTSRQDLSNDANRTR